MTKGKNDTAIFRLGSITKTSQRVPHLQGPPVVQAESSCKFSQQARFPPGLFCHLQAQIHRDENALATDFTTWISQESVKDLNSCLKPEADSRINFKIEV